LSPRVVGGVHVLLLLLLLLLADELMLLIGVDVNGIVGNAVVGDGDA